MSTDGCQTRFHSPMNIKPDSEIWGYVNKHKDIIEETEYFQRPSEQSKQTDLKMNTLSLFALAS